MRRALSCVLLVLSAAPVFAASPTRLSTVTLVLDFKGPHSDPSIEVMKKELGKILGATGVRFEWRSLEEASSSTSENLVVVRFNGRCILEPDPLTYDERGPLAFTHTVDGSVLPFSEVACDTVTNSLRSAILGGNYKRADLLMGRALGRVVAHELVHILTNSGAHAHEGVQNSGLSGTQLIGEQLTLTEADLRRVKQHLGD